MCQTPGKDWEFIQGPGLCLVRTSCKGSILLQVFIHSLNHGKLIGFHTGMSRSCFLLLFVWTRADNSSGIFQTAQSLLRFLQTNPCRQTDSTEEGNNRAGFVMVTSYLCRVSTRGCRMNADCPKYENKSIKTKQRCKQGCLDPMGSLTTVCLSGTREPPPAPHRQSNSSGADAEPPTKQWSMQWYGEVQL